MFLRNDHDLQQSGAGAALSFGRRVETRKPTLIDRIHARFPDFELVPDLGSRIGSREWFRGAATCFGLCAVTLLLSPGFENPIYGYTPPALSGSEWQAARAQAIAPLGQGGGSGYHMAATNLVAPLGATPERPILNLDLRLPSGNSLASVLRRSGVGADEASKAVTLIGNAVSLGDLKTGTELDLTLGRRLDKSQPRPLENLAFRARFDLNLKIERHDGQLALVEMPIAIDNTPLRIRGTVGSSLYRSARAAGAPAKAVEAYIRAVAGRVPMSQVGSNGQFEIIVSQKRAATGEVQIGDLLYAGLDRGGNKLQLVKWDQGGKTQWLDGMGRGERQGMMSMPVAGRLTSSFGVRVHPVLGFKRMHKGLDIAAAYGSPIRAAMDGTVTMAGWAGGYGNFVKLSHASGYATGYGHMSRIAVRSGTHVSRGQVIGYVGSTGLSTGPHVHYEVWRNGASVNPAGISVTTQSALQGSELREFRARLAGLLATPLGGGTKDEDD